MPERLPTLADERRRRGLSQRQVANHLGVPQRAISQLEHGELTGLNAELIDRYLAHLARYSTSLTEPRRVGGS